MLLLDIFLTSVETIEHHYTQDFVLIFDWIVSKTYVHVSFVRFNIRQFHYLSSGWITNSDRLITRAADETVYGACSDVVDQSRDCHVVSGDDVFVVVVGFRS